MKTKVISAILLLPLISCEPNQERTQQHNSRGHGQTVKASCNSTADSIINLAIIKSDSDILSAIDILDEAIKIDSTCAQSYRLKGEYLNLLDSKQPATMGDGYLMIADSIEGIKIQ